MTFRLICSLTETFYSGTITMVELVSNFASQINLKVMLVV